MDISIHRRLMDAELKLAGVVELHGIQNATLPHDAAVGCRRAREKPNAQLASKLATARAWDLKETFSYFWKYKSVTWAGGFLDYWCFRAMRSRLEPMRKVARMLRAHEPLILNWFPLPKV